MLGVLLLHESSFRLAAEGVKAQQRKESRLRGVDSSAQKSRS